MKSQVAIVACRNYDEQAVINSVREGISLLGGTGRFASPGESLLIKPNLLAADSPEKAVTTHPLVFKGVARLFGLNNNRLSYGDSPGIGAPNRVAKKAGIQSVADELDIPLGDFKNGRRVSHPRGLIARQMTLARGALDADGIISISKMKTHALTAITGAVKNTFGCVPGFLKEEYHLKMKDITQFSKVLVDVNLFLKPRLYIMDGIAAMEGNGPRSGEVRKMGVLLFSSDPVALDAVFCRLIDLNPLYVPFMEIARRAGLGTHRTDEIELLGDDPGKLIQGDFKIRRRPVRKLVFFQNLPSFLKNQILSRPVMDRNRCTNCGSCVRQCPVPEKAVNWIPGKKSEKPHYDYRKCIRCFCCQEICPEKAISVTTPFLGKMIFR